MLEKIREVSILYDFYGELLPEKQREIFRMYHEDNYSLAEIGEDLGITRQGVHEAFKRACERLIKYEEKLGLAEKFLNTEKAFSEIETALQDIISEYAEDTMIKAKLLEIKKIITELNE